MPSNPETTQRQEELVELFHGSRIHRITGMRLSYTEDGRARFDMPYNPNFDHALDGVHGGLIATLIDNAGWFTAAARYDTWIATVEFQVRLLEPVEKRDLVSLGRIVRSGKRLTVAEMEVRDGDGRLVATGSGTFTVTGVSRKT